MSRTSGKVSSRGSAWAFMRTGSCSEALIHVLDRAFDHPAEVEEHATAYLAGGIMQHGYQCGMIWGAALAAGAQAHRLFGPGPEGEARAIVASQRLVESFRARNREINCLEITETDWKPSWRLVRYFVKGGPVGCVRMAARFGPEALREINSALSAAEIEAPEPPVSCAAELARKMGASDLQVAMAAGLAGGIGLSGGGCGALGAAAWLLSLRNPAKPAGFSFSHPQISDAIERFLPVSGHEIECADIVGRRFVDIDDHAAHLRAGGCAKLIDALAGEQ